MTHVVVIAGGYGTRFWPKSTQKKPKQFLSWDDQETSLFVQTVNRMDPSLVSGVSVITTAGLENLIAEHAKKTPYDCHIIIEPQQKNTAACVYLAAKLLSQEQDPVLTVCPADHYVHDKVSFNQTLNQAIDWASTHPDILLLGVIPSRPEIGFGYIEIQKIENQASTVTRFVEKPSHEKAIEFLAQGNMLWNSGLFIAKCSVLLEQFLHHQPIFDQTWKESQGNLAQFYEKIPHLSFDVAILEKSKNIRCFSLNCGWDDVGNFPRFFELAKKFVTPVGANYSTSNKLITVDASHNLIDVPQKMVALLGVHNLVVIQTPESLLIADKQHLSELKGLVDEVKIQFPELA
jgi:mannose-1-phosphate guanylyltransferase